MINSGYTAVDYLGGKENVAVDGHWWSRNPLPTRGTKISRKVGPKKEL